MKHEFAVYFPKGPFRKGMELVIDEKEIVHRVVHVLRLRVGEEIVIFDKNRHILLAIESVEKNKVHGIVKSVKENKKLKPHLVVQLGLLKRDALETAIYALSQIGINEIVLFTSEKVQRKWGGVREFERLHRVIIAAAEQSKNFCLPTLHAPVPVQKLLKNLTNESNIFFDVGGLGIKDLLCGTLSKSYVLMIGPEGDLSISEKRSLFESGYKTYRLTPTVLTSVQAAILGTGIIRCFT